MSERWYVARARSGQERIALDNLSGQSFETYYPTIHIERYRKTRIVETQEGLFPGYLFVKFGIEETRWRAINNTRGILKLLSFAQDGTPSPIPAGEVEYLQAQEKHRQLQKYVKTGDQVRLRRGPGLPLSYVIGTSGKRVEFLMHLLNREVRCKALRDTLYVVAKDTDSVSVRKPETLPLA